MLRHRRCKKPKGFGGIYETGNENLRRILHFYRRLWRLKFPKKCLGYSTSQHEKKLTNNDLMNSFSNFVSDLGQKYRKKKQFSTFPFGFSIAGPFYLVKLEKDDKIIQLAKTLLCFASRKVMIINYGNFQTRIFIEANLCCCCRNENLSVERGKNLDQ